MRHRLVAPLVSVLALALGAAAASAQVSGTLVCNGKKAAIGNAYAYFEKGFADPKKDDVVVMLSDAPLDDATARDTFKVMDLRDAGKVHALKIVIDTTSKQIISVVIYSKDMTKPMSGAGTNFKLDLATMDGKTIAGKTYTEKPDEFFGDTFEWNVSFSAPIKPRK